MNIHAVCFLSVVALATIVVIHNIFLVRRCERLKEGQKTWRTLAHRYAEKVVIKQGELWEANRLSMNKGALLNLCKREKLLLIEAIWGSQTIVRDLRDVYTIICDLRERLAANEKTSRGLASVIQKQDIDLKGLHNLAEHWEGQARKNADLVFTLIRNAWAIRQEEQGGEIVFRVCNTADSMKTLAIGDSPEATLALAVQRQIVQEAAEL